MLTSIDLAENMYWRSILGLVYLFRTISDAITIFQYVIAFVLLQLYAFQIDI